MQEKEDYYKSKKPISPMVLCLRQNKPPISERLKLNHKINNQI
jgi:hypothetical protein